MSFAFDLEGASFLPAESGAGDATAADPAVGQKRLLPDGCDTVTDQKRLAQALQAHFRSSTEARSGLAQTTKALQSQWEVIRSQTRTGFAQGLQAQIRSVAEAESGLAQRTKVRKIRWTTLDR